MKQIMDGLRSRMGDVFASLSRAQEFHACGKDDEAHGHLIAASNDLTIISAAVEGLRKAVWACKGRKGDEKEEEEAA